MQVKAGEADPEMLTRAERILNRMERRLVSLDSDYKDAKQKASGALAGGGCGRPEGGEGAACFVVVPSAKGVCRTSTPACMVLGASPV